MSLRQAFCPQYYYYPSDCAEETATAREPDFSQVLITTSVSVLEMY